MKSFSVSEIQTIQKNLLAWFKKNQRPLPWRKKYEPYQVWISEIMLQQTQVKTALPYFDRWMKALPTIASVASAKQDKILKLWEGLGYYSRARNLQKAAQKIMAEYDGKFPEKYETILKLPGVGKYTAGAISSIAFNQDQPLVDGNVIRVIARLLDFSGNTRLPENIKQMWKRAGELLPKEQARDFNQGLMELGALLCKPKNPDCNACPVQKMCSSSQAGTMNEIPNRGKAVRLESIKVAIAVIKKNGKVFIQKRPASGLMGGLWEFPGGKIMKGEKPMQAIHREIQEEIGITIKNVKPLTRIKHGYTRFKVDLHCFLADYDAGNIKLKAASHGKWVEIKQLKKFPFPAANVILIDTLMSEENNS